MRSTGGLHHTDSVLKFLREYAQLFVGLALIGALVFGVTLTQPDRDREPSSASDYVAPTPSTVTVTPEPEVAPVASGVLHGWVTDPSGRPVEGVPVRVARAPFEIQEARLGYVPAGPVHDTTTDAEGRYRFEQLDTGEYRLRVGAKRGPWALAWHPAAAGVRAAEGFAVKQDATTRRDIEVVASATVAGTVQAPRDQTVNIQLQQRVTPTEAQPEPWLTVRSLGDRRTYRFHHLPPGDYRVAVHASGSGVVHAPAATSPKNARVVTLEPGETVDAVDVAVPEPAVLTGVVTTSAGTPVVGHDVAFQAGWRVVDPRFPSVPSVTADARTDAAGRYRLELPTGTWAIQLDGCGGPPDQRVRVVAGRTHTLDLSTDAVASVSGRLTRPDGRPYAGVQVSVAAADAACAPAAESDADGRWTVTGVEPGPARIDYGVHRQGAFTSYLHPGVTDLADLVTVPIGLGAEVTGVDAVLP